MAAGVLASSLAVPLLGAQPGSAATSGADWPAFRFGAAHLGVTPETTLNSGTVAALSAGPSAAVGAASDSSPAVVTKAGTTRVYVGDLAGVLHADNGATGAQLWSFKVGGTKPAIYTSPTVFGGDVYVASGTGTLYALNASTGALVCSFVTGKRIQSSPTVVADADGSGPLVYVGTEEGGGEWAVYGAANTHGACTEDWYFNHFPVASGTWSSAAYGTDAAGEHLVVFGSKDPDDSVYALDAGTGAEVWRYQTSTLTEQDVGAAPLVSAPGVNGLVDGAAYVEGKDGVLYALDLASGALLWKDKVANPGLNVSSASLAHGTLVVGSTGGVFAFNAATGASLWHALTGVSVASSPAVSGGTGTQVAFVGGLAGNLYALGLAGGTVLWTGTDSSGFYASPAVSHGVLYDIDRGGTLHSYS